MVRICSVQGESSESMSFLKVDGGKKQLMLCETSAQRRSSASAPKTFTFDAIFSQDASQVSSPAAGTLPYLLPGISVGNVTAGSFSCTDLLLVTQNEHFKVKLSEFSK